MRTTSTLIIGAGQAGLALSHCLTTRGLDHVVVERGRPGERWRSERWDSLRLLTPNWMSRLPGYRYAGAEPDGFMTMADVIDYLEGYAASFGAPVEQDTTVLSLHRAGDGFLVRTSRGHWRARNVVIATGHCDTPFVPACAAHTPANLRQVVPTRYRRPSDLPEGGVLVVGASATGVQLADELHASGRPVTLAVGHHTRLPRRYRGRDILWWLDAMGVLDQRIDQVPDPRASVRQPSLQLVGRARPQTLDLLALHRAGVRLAGRLLDFTGHTAHFDDDLIATTAAADLKLAALRLRIDAFVRERRLEGDVEPAEPFAPTWPLGLAGPEHVDLKAAGVSAIVWATGYTRRYPWLQVPVLDERGEVRHDGGVTPCPGLYVLGLNFLRHRKSSFIDGVGADAEAVAAHLAARMRGQSLAVA
jgi:putative flavoprotein involved in K+ transport